MTTTETYPSASAVEFIDDDELTAFLVENPLCRAVAKLCLGRARSGLKTRCYLIATYPDDEAKHRALMLADERTREYSRQSNRAVIQRRHVEMANAQIRRYHPQSATS